MGAKNARFLSLRYEGSTVLMIVVGLNGTLKPVVEYLNNLKNMLTA